MTPPQSQMETDKEQIMVVSPPEQLSRNDDDYDDECDDDDDDEDHHDLSFACHEHRVSAEYHKPPVGWNCDNHNYHG